MGDDRWIRYATYALRGVYLFGTLCILSMIRMVFAVGSANTTMVWQAGGAAVLFCLLMVSAGGVQAYCQERHLSQP